MYHSALLNQPDTYNMSVYRFVGQTNRRPCYITELKAAIAKASSQTPEAKVQTHQLIFD